jgi:putative endopeptidase
LTVAVNINGTLQSMDEAALEKNGLAPLQAALAKIAAIKTATDLAQVLGEQLSAEADPLNAVHVHFNSELNIDSMTLQVASFSIDDRLQQIDRDWRVSIPSAWKRIQNQNETWRERLSA